jgi:SAM-dependent methyltransferase
MGAGSLSHKEKLRGFYAPLIAQHREPFKAVGWGSGKGQATRFRLLSQACAQSGCETVLDVGCGLGDFSYYRQRGYTGIDVVPEMIEAASSRHPAIATEFLECDLLTPPALGERRFDAVVASGIFGIAIRPAYPSQMIAAMWKHARKLLAFNMLSAEVHKSEREAFEAYYEIGEIAAMCQCLTPYVMIDHTYRRNDFTVCMYREQQEV